VQDWPESYRFVRRQHNEIVDVGSWFINEFRFARVLLNRVARR